VAFRRPECLEPVIGCWRTSTVFPYNPSIGSVLKANNSLNLPLINPIKVFFITCVEEYILLYWTSVDKNSRVSVNYVLEFVGFARSALL
jgi:hypothetical protein